MVIVQIVKRKNNVQRKSTKKKYKEKARTLVLIHVRAIFISRKDYLMLMR